MDPDSRNSRRSSQQDCEPLQKSTYMQERASMMSVEQLKPGSAGSNADLLM